MSSIRMKSVSKSTSHRTSIVAQRTISVRLPQQLKPLFWEFDFHRLSWGQHRDLVILKVLSAGGLADWKWLRGQMSTRELRNWIIAQHGRGLTPRQLSFWQVVLGIPASEVRRWLDAPERQVWDRR